MTGLNLKNLLVPIKKILKMEQEIDLLRSERPGKIITGIFLMTTLKNITSRMILSKNTNYVRKV